MGWRERTLWKNFGMPPETLFQVMDSDILRIAFNCSPQMIRTIMDLFSFLMARAAVQNALGGSKFQKMNRPYVLSARGHIVSLCPYRHIYFISEPDSFRKRFGYVFLIGISAKGLFGTVNRNEQRHGITRPVICLPRYLGRFGSIAAHRKPVHLWQGKTHQTLCQGAWPL